MTFLTPKEAARFLKISTDTLNRQRYKQFLIEGIHYTKINSRLLRYNLEALEALMRGEAPRRGPGRPRKEAVAK